MQAGKCPKGTPSGPFGEGGGMSPLGRISNGLGGDPCDSAIWLPCSAFASTPCEATRVPTP